MGDSISPGPRGGYCTFIFRMSGPMRFKAFAASLLSGSSSMALSFAIVACNDPNEQVHVVNYPKDEKE